MEITSASQAVGGLLYSLLFALVVFMIAWRAGYFRLPPKGSYFPVTIRQTLGIFLLYFVLAFLILPTLLFLFKRWLGWGEIVSFFSLFFCLLGYCFLIKKEARTFIFGRFSYKSIGMGLLSLGVSYPFVSLMGNLSSLISLMIWKEAKVEQVAVQQLKLLRGEPLLFGFMVFLVVIVVPFMEELLFRGFLQSLLKRYIGRLGGLSLTALIFASVHFATSQGTGNFQLISTLFILALFLGFIYERERGLSAPFALHASFNALSVLLIIFE